MLEQIISLESPPPIAAESLEEKAARKRARNLAYSRSAKGKATRRAYLNKPGVKEKRNARTREWRASPAGKEWMRRWNHDPVVKDAKARHEKTTRARQVQRAFMGRVRAGVLEAYGGESPKCACCGTEKTEFLVIDHINGGGNKHRKEINANLYLWLRNNNYPKGFRLLCHNCNFSLSAHGYCPHRGTE